MNAFEAFLIAYKKRAGSLPAILNRDDLKAVFQIWPEAKDTLKGLIDLFGECEIEISQVDVIGAALKDPGETKPPELIIKLAAAYNLYHERRLKAEAYFNGPAPDPKFKPAYEDVLKNELAARVVLEDLKFIDGVFYLEDEKGFLKLYRETETGMKELKIKRRAA